MRPARGLHVPSDYWNGLDPFERSMHMARAMARQHPKWVFVGNIAATAHGFEHSWKLHDGTVSIASAYHNGLCRIAKVRRVIFRSNACQWRWLTGCLFLTKYVQC